MMSMIMTIDNGNDVNKSVNDDNGDNGDNVNSGKDEDNSINEKKDIDNNGKKCNNVNNDEGESCSRPIICIQQNIHKEEV